MSISVESLAKWSPLIERDGERKRVLRFDTLIWMTNSMSWLYVLN